MRKFVIGFVSLCAVLGAFLLYNRISGSPPIETGQQVDIMQSAADVNVVSFDSEIGKIGDVGIGTTKKAYYTKLNKITKEIEQEWGFEKVLSEARDVWDVEKPYMNIFRRNFKCYITADKGKVQVETAVGRTTPKDATFSSNVVARILFGPPGDVKESFVYLDNFVFLSEKSLLSTADPCDPVKFVSEDILMNGTGMELIYNEQTERLEYFKINNLDSLQIAGSQAAMFTERNVVNDASIATNSAEPNEPNETSDAKIARAPEANIQPQAEQEQGVYYKCTFSKNVLVNSPEQLIFTGDKLCINDILWSKSSANEPNEIDADNTTNTKAAAETDEPDRMVADSTGGAGSTEPEHAEPNTLSDRQESIVVTCDNGFEVMPRDSVRAKEDTAASNTVASDLSFELSDQYDNGANKTRFLTQQIDYNLATGDGVANGVSEFLFYVGSTSNTKTNRAPVPVKVNARKRVRFSNTSNKVVFKGDCIVKMPQSGLTRPRDVTFSAPEITVNLPQDNSKQPDMTANGPSELVFYMEDPNNTNENIEPLPVTVNASKQARFLAASNQIIFGGDSRCTMLREDPNCLVKYILLSEHIVVDLPDDMNDPSASPETGIKHLTATGEVVRLAMTKTAKEETTLATGIRGANTGKILSGIELKCRRFDYDTIQQQFLATGPGVINLDNSQAPEPNEPVGRFSLRNPCWAIIDGFETLTYFIEENRAVIGKGSLEKFRIDYIPAVEGRFDEFITTQTSLIEAILYEGPDGQMQLSTLTASGGIEYEDKDTKFIGSTLFYDHESSIIKVNGDETQPCYYKGALVDRIVINEKTGEVEAKIIGPGMLQINK